LANRKVSLILSVYYGAAFIEDAVRSVLSQDFTDFEFTIIDGASTAQIEEIITKSVTKSSD